MCDYEITQRALDAKAEANYAALADSLDPEVKKILADKDGKIRATESSVANHSWHDVSDLPIGVNAPDMAEAIDTPEEIVAEQFDLTPGQAEGIVCWHKSILEKEGNANLAIALARALGVILRAKNLKLEVVALAFATGTASVNGFSSMTKAAKQIFHENGKAITRAALSKRSVWWISFLNLPPSSHMKSKAASQSYSEARKANHWRKSPERIKKIVSRLDKLPN